jgi:hypothetical protein
MEFVERIAEKIQTITLNGNGQIADQLKQLFILTAMLIILVELAEL